MKCPKCGSKRVAPILYGMPAYDEEMERQLNNEELYLGGCCISGMEPEYHCFECGKDVASPPVLLSKNGEEDYRDIVTSIRFSDGGFFGGYPEVMIKRTDEKIMLDVRPGFYEPERSLHREMSEAEWKKLLDRLYCKLYLHEWKKTFNDWSVLDGEQWELELKLTGGRVRNYKGSNAFPPYWEDKTGRIRSHNYNGEFGFKEGATWSAISSGDLSVRYCPKGFLFDSKGAKGFAKNGSQDLLWILGLLNSKVSMQFLQFISPTLDFKVGDVVSLPFISDKDKYDKVLSYVEALVSCSKTDWDSFETSWDFKRHPLVPLASEKKDQEMTQFAAFRMEKFGRLSWHYQKWEQECQYRFEHLKEDEEALNRIFIDIYGLQDELTQVVEDKDVAIRRAELQRDIKTLLSYAVGCMFGRYSLDIEGLAYAGGVWDASNYTSFIPDQDNVIPITDEEYLEDDIVSRLCIWLKVVYGESNLEENLDFIAKALGNKGSSSREIIRNYFMNDFFKDHCQTYSVTGSGKRPIYWLFDSGKQNGFKALIYLHRYNADTIGNLRIDYLHRMQRIYESEISRMQDMIDHSTNAREVAQATKRREKMIKQLKECREYDEKLTHLALSRIELDLDDGVKKNYRKIQTANDGKFYEVLADSKNIMSKE